MSAGVLRNFICWMLVFLCPLTLAAEDTKSAVLHSDGGVWVNGQEIAASTAIFPGDLIETKPGFVANLDADGSAVLIQPESIVKFQGNFLDLEHGSVAVGTSTSMSVHVNCIKVEPISTERTQFDVADLSGTVQVVAHKNDVNIRGSAGLKKATTDNNAQSATVHEGHEASRDEAVICGAALRPETAGSGLNTKWLEIGGGAGGAILLCILLCKSSNHGGTSVSPSAP
jgi:hypothetical protein